MTTHKESNRIEEVCETLHIAWGLWAARVFEKQSGQNKADRTNSFLPFDLYINSYDRSQHCFHQIFI